MFRFIDEYGFIIVLSIVFVFALVIMLVGFINDQQIFNAPRENCFVIEKDYDDRGPFVVIVYDYEYKGEGSSDTFRYYCTSEEYIAFQVGDLVCFAEGNRIVIPWMEDPIK